MKQQALLLASASCCLGACAPSLDDQTTLVDRARLLAVVAEPAEVRPQDEVTFSPAVAGSGASPLRFRFCQALPSPADPRPAAQACFAETGDWLAPSGRGARGVVPADACARFGPEPTSSNLRPRDADRSGGFYLPVVVSGLDTPSLFLLRLHCALPDAPADVARELAQRYSLNLNPHPAGLTLANTTDPTHPDALLVRAGAPTELRLHWDASQREDYVWLPPEGAALEPRHEALRVSWYSAGGSFAASSTGSDEPETATFSANTFTAPAGVSAIDLWLVLQDSRGGSGVGRWRVSVDP